MPCSLKSKIKMPCSPKTTSNDSKKLTLVPFVFITYMLICGGPYGVELLVGAAGPLMAILGFKIFPLFWNIPGMLMTTELVSTFPENGGYVVWAHRAFGPFWAFLLGFWKFALNIHYLVAFLALFADFFYEDFSEGLNIFPHVLVVLLSIVLLSFLNYTSLVNVGYTVMGLSILVVLPFLVLFLVSIPRIEPSRWYNRGDGNVQKDWKTYFSGYFWLLNFWDDASALAGEVDQAPQTFYKAIWIATSLRFLSYLLPLLATIGALPSNQEMWTNGYFGDAAELIVGTWLKSWIRAGRVCAYYGLFQARLTCVAYQLVGMASLGIVPKKIGNRLTWCDVPAMGNTLTILIIIIVYYVDKGLPSVSLYVLQTLAILMEMASYLWLRKKLPDLDILHRVPMGIRMHGLLTVCLVSATYSIYITVLNVGIPQYIMTAVLTLFGILLYSIMQLCKSRNWLEFNEMKDS